LNPGSGSGQNFWIRQKGPDPTGSGSGSPTLIFFVMFPVTDSGKVQGHMIGIPVGLKFERIQTQECRIPVRAGPIFIQIYRYRKLFFMLTQLCALNVFYSVAEPELVERQLFAGAEVFLARLRSRVLNSLKMLQKT
jgi:hypothetical protein